MLTSAQGFELMVAMQSPTGLPCVSKMSSSPPALGRSTGRLRAVGRAVAVASKTSSPEPAG
jgi:hypothetical protein